MKRDLKPALLTLLISCAVAALMWFAADQEE